MKEYSMNPTSDASVNDHAVLSDAHRTLLEQGSGIAPEVIAERGYRTSTGYSELKSLSIPVPRHADPTGLLLPVWGVDGRPAAYFSIKEDRPIPYVTFRPDYPLPGADGRDRKYLNPKGTSTRLDAHPRTTQALTDPTTRLWITEGIKKGDALVSHGATAIAILGVDNWRHPADWTDVALEGRRIGIVYDSDVMVKTAVTKALARVTEYLQYKGATVQHAYLPHNGGTKTGIDDFLLIHTLTDLEALLEPPRGLKGAPSYASTDWRSGLLCTKSGEPKETFGNLLQCAAEVAKRDALWYDAVADRAMIRDEPLTDALVEQAAASIERTLRLPIRNLRLVRTALVAQCRQDTRDPIQAWLHSLAPWDQTPRLLTWGSTYAGMPATTYGQEAARLWIVSMVARALAPGCQCRSVFVLMGEEEIGKSELVKLLASERWYRDVSGSLDGKEAHMLLKGTWVVELGELATMGKTEENRLKSFITMTNDEFIPKYANDPVKLARRTILVGTLNPDGDHTFLRGQTGNTRYYPLPVKHVALEEIKAIRDQLFAEALVYYATHPDDWWCLGPDATKGVKEVRETYRVKSVYEESLGAWLEGRTTPTCWQDIHENFLLLEAKEKWKDTTLQKQIATALRANGWCQDDKQTRMGSYGAVRAWRK